MNPDIRTVLAKMMTGDQAADARLGIALDCAVAFGMWLAKTNTGGAGELDAHQLARMFFEKAARI